MLAGTISDINRNLKYLPNLTTKIKTNLKRSISEKHSGVSTCHFGPHQANYYMVGTAGSDLVLPATRLTEDGGKESYSNFVDSFQSHSLISELRAGNNFCFEW